jgi:hypothetical protein
MTDVVLSWYGQVHEFHHPTAITRNGEVTLGCGNIQDGRTCGQPERSRVHSFIASQYLTRPAVTVDVLIATATEMVRFGTLGWNAENANSWYSAWFKPEREPRWYRVEVFDCKSASQVAMFLEQALTRTLDADSLTDKEHAS